MLTVPLQIGDKIVYTPLFLASIGAKHTDPLWFAKGSVVRFHDTDPTLVYVDWGDGENLINKTNVAKPLTVEATEVPLWYNEPRGRRRR